MKQSMRNILEELYALDSSLKQYESDLVLLIQNMEQARPHATVDAAFVQHLRQQLVSDTSHTDRIYPLPLIKKISFAIGGAVIAIVIIVPTMLWFQKDSSISFSEFNDTAGFEKLASNAFGSLPGEGAGSRPPAAESFLKEASFGSEGMRTNISDESVLMAPYSVPVQLTRFKYVYSGGTDGIDDKQLPVFKRVIQSNTNVSTIIRSLGLGLVDLGTLHKPALQTVVIMDDDNNGYSVSINYEMGLISMQRRSDEQHMPEPYRPIAWEDVPSDNALIAQTDAFLAQWNIDISSYSAPIVLQEWRSAMDAARLDGRDNLLYVPDYATVVYPLKIGDKLVYNGAGSPDGLTLTVNLRTLEVVTMHNLAIQLYQESLYDVTTDIPTLVRLYNERQGVYPLEFDLNEIEIILGAPTLGWITHFQFTDTIPNQLFVPAYIFPVLEKPEQLNFMMDVIVMPLPTEIVKQWGSGEHAMTMPGGVPAREAQAVESEIVELGE